MDDKKKQVAQPQSVDWATAGGPEQVNHPSHYGADHGVECIDVMRQIATPEEFQGFCRLSAFKYLFRLRAKDKPAQDAAKAEVYCRWLKESLEADHSD